MAVSANKVYSQTLQSIIDAKLEELVKKHTVYEHRKAEALNAIAAESDPLSQLHLLLQGTKHCFQIHQMNSGDLISSSTNRQKLFKLLINVEKFLEQPRYDASVSDSLLVEWKSSLLQELDSQSSRYEFASLYAKIVTEWLSSEKRLAASSAEDADTEMIEDFVELDNSDKLDSKSAWERSVFEEPKHVQEEKLRMILAKLFGEGDAAKKGLFKALGALHEEVSAFETELTASGQFTEAVIRWCIEGLIGRGRFNDEKRTVLKDFLNNSTILDELADVLNLRMANISEWSWGEDVIIELRRRVTGKYSIDMSEDLLQAIFLHYVGSKWAVFLRHALVKIVDNPEAWVASIKDIPIIDHRRREYYLGQQGKKQSLEARRSRLWRRKYLLTQLPTVEWQRWLSHDGEEEADYAKKNMAPRKQLASKAARKSAPSSQADLDRLHQAGAKRARRVESSDDEDEDDADDDFDSDEGEDDDNGDEDEQPRDMMELKQGLLHLLQTEILLNTHLHGELTAFRGQFERWDDLLPHSTIMVVLSFLGVSSRWTEFFQTFLQAPLSFLHDGQLESTRMRKRGIPASHPLSDALGEAVLFCVDLLINQECEGTKLWRMHDDIWLWSPNHNLCTKAWTSIQKFSKAFGLVLHEPSLGAAVIGKKSKGVRRGPGLPSTPIRWGFLYLNSETGEFDIDQNMVDSHIEDLNNQLRDKATKGVFSWIQAWNAYAITFFATNFGKPAFCFGPSHIQKILSTLQQIQQSIFGESNMIKYIREMIAQRHGIASVPDGYLFFPTILGGLDMRNPFIRPIQLNKALVEENPQKRFKSWETSERETYESLKKAFEGLVTRGVLPTYGRYRNTKYTPRADDKHKFMSFEEYTKHREEYSYKEIPKDNRLSDIFTFMLGSPRKDSVDLSRPLLDAVNSSAVANRNSSLRRNNSIQPYWQWIFEVYGPEIIKKFGGLNIVDAGVLPIGMVSLVKGDRVEWK